MILGEEEKKVENPSVCIYRARNVFCIRIPSTRIVFSFYKTRFFLCSCPATDRQQVARVQQYCSDNCLRMHCKIKISLNLIRNLQFYARNYYYDLSVMTYSGDEFAYAKILEYQLQYLFKIIFSVHVR